MKNLIQCIMASRPDTAPQSYLRPLTHQHSANSLGANPPFLGSFARLHHSHLPTPTAHTPSRLPPRSGTELLARLPFLERCHIGIIASIPPSSARTSLRRSNRNSLGTDRRYRTGSCESGSPTTVRCEIRHVLPRVEGGVGGNVFPSCLKEEC